MMINRENEPTFEGRIFYPSHLGRALREQSLKRINRRKSVTRFFDLETVCKIGELSNHFPGISIETFPTTPHTPLDSIQTEIKGEYKLLYRFLTELTQDK